MAGERIRDGGFGFAQSVGPDGYVWWYIDALSDDGQHGLTIIAFIGSVFSSYYAHAIRAGKGDPENHCAMNVVLYGPRGKRWAFTERGRAALRRGATSLSIGPSSLSWEDGVLTARIDEITAPIPTRLRGTIRLFPGATTQHDFFLDANGNHRWRPVAPVSRVEVDLDRPRLSWAGGAYHDCNHGDEPMERAFREWDWCRAPVGDDTAILYNVSARDRSSLRLALRVDPAGTVSHFDVPPAVALPQTKWRVSRSTGADPDYPVSVTQTLEDAPFYARSVLATKLLGRETTAFHESLDLDRFDARWVQALIPFRNPRALR